MGGTLSASPEVLASHNERLDRGDYDDFLCMRFPQIDDVFL